MIDVRDVSKCYRLYDRPRDRLLQTLCGNRRTYYRDFWALRDVSLKIRRGDAVGIVGRNGAGKSTLLQLIAGTLAPTDGEISVRGRVAALLQLGSGFNPEFTGRENVFLNGAILGFSRAQVRARFDQVAAFADIGAFIDQPLKTYSTGMAMRLAFAVSVFLEPEILIIDEALAVGDTAFQYRCRERINQLLRNGTTLLFVSHDIGLVKSICTHALYLSAGRVVAQGNPEEIAERYQFDNRQAEAAYLTAGAVTLQEKPRLNPQSPLCFGTGEGGILGVRFEETGGGMHCHFVAGMPIVFSVETWIGTALRDAVLTIHVQTRNLIGIGGQRVALGAGAPEERRGCVIRFTLPTSNLAAGDFFITVLIEERTGVGKYRTIEKQPGILSFKLDQPRGHEFLPIMDLDIRHDMIAPLSSGGDA